MTAKKIDHDAIWNKFNGCAKPESTPSEPNNPEPLGEGFDDPEPEDDSDAQAQSHRVPAMTPEEDAAALAAMHDNAFAKFNNPPKPER